jgi:hypothetical protein
VKKATLIIEFGAYNNQKEGIAMCPKCGGFVIIDQDETYFSRFLDQKPVSYCINCGMRFFAHILKQRIWTWRKGYLGPARV